MKTTIERQIVVFLTLMALLLLGVSPLSAEIYKWVDENGVTHFSDQKPAGADSGKEVVVDPSKTGSLTVLESGDNNASLFSYIKEYLTSDEKSEINKNASVIIYTTDW